MGTSEPKAARAANSLTGKTAVVTGGATGIGHAVALALGRAGANVVVGDLRLEPKPGSYDERPELSVIDLLKEEGFQGIFCRTDVTDPSQVEALAETAIEHFGSVDIWVNNAGVVAQSKPIHVFDDDELATCLAVNTWGVWHGMRAAIRHMLAANRGGSIVNVLSTAAIRPHANQSIYDISKAAAAQATRCAALELGARKIRVNAVCPTIVKTAISRWMVEQEGFGDWMKSKLPLGELVETREVADAVLFLAGDTASAITGVMLPVDMGEQLGPPTEEAVGGGEI